MSITFRHIIIISNNCCFLFLYIRTRSKKIRKQKAVVDEESTLADEHCHGNIGIAAVLQHRKTIINFRDMFVKFEK